MFWFAYPTILIDDEEQQLVAYATFCLYPSHAGRTVLYLMDVGVRPESRGQGLATELLQARLKIAADLGATMAVGAVSPENESIRHLMKKAGFRESHTIAGYYHDQDPVQDAIILYGGPEVFRPGGP